MDDDPDRERLSIHDLLGEDRAAERIENDRWVHEWNRVIAVADRVEDRYLRQAIIDDFVRRFHADLERRYLKRK